MEVLQISEKNLQEKMKSKAMLRKEVLARRKALSRGERENGSAELTKNIMSHPWFCQAASLLIFVSYGSEIDTLSLLQKALTLGKKVFVPKVEGQEMQFYRIFSAGELSKGYHGILEPSGESERYCEAERLAQNEQVLMLLPGAVFDEAGGRIGYGGGFYDRYLADKPELQGFTIGIGFSCQLVDALPTEETDIRVAQVITVGERLE